MFDSASGRLVHQALERAALRWPDRVFISSGGCDHTYQEIHAMASRLARFLQNRGVERGDRVAVFASNSAEVVVAFFAALAAGAAYMPISSQTKASRLRTILADAEPAALIAEARLGPVWREASCPSLRAIVEIGAPGLTDEEGETVPFGKAMTDLHGGWTEPPTIDQDLAALIYTSGSTGDPKGVMLGHRNIVSAIASIGSYLGIRRNDVIFCALPLSFGYGLTQILLAAEVGARVVLEPSFAFPLQVLEQVQKERVTVLPGVPTLFAQLLATPGLADCDLSALRIVTNAAAALPEPHIARLRSALPDARLYLMHGLTECLRTSYLPPDELDRRPSSVGKGMANVELYLVDEEGRRLPPGSTGELVVRGANVMLGYWRKPAETARTLRPGPVPGERVLHTGDLFRTDDEGFFYFVARLDDLIKVRGEKVSPREVEAVLLEIDGVLEATAFEVPDPVDGQAIRAVVALEPGCALTEREIQRHCASVLERSKVPRHVVLVDALPRTPNGKVDKLALKQAS